MIIDPYNVDHIKARSKPAFKASTKIVEQSINNQIRPKYNFDIYISSQFIIHSLFVTTYPRWLIIF